MIEIGEQITVLLNPANKFHLRDDNRIYTVKGIITTFDGKKLLILHQDSGKNISVSSLTKHDCKYYGIEYTEGLQLWPLAMNWFNITKWRRTALAIQRAQINDINIKLSVLTNDFSDKIVKTIQHQKEVDKQNRELKTKIYLELRQELIDKENKRIETLQAVNTYKIKSTEKQIETLTSSISLIYEQAYINRCRSSLMDDCLHSAGVRDKDYSDINLDIKDFVHTSTPVRLDQYEYELKMFHIFQFYISYVDKIKKLYNNTLYVKELNGVKNISESDMKGVSSSVGLHIIFEDTNDWMIFDSLFNIIKSEHKQNHLMLWYYNAYITNEAQNLFKTVLNSESIKYKIEKI